MTCIDGFLLDGLICKSNCPDGKFVDPITLACNTCPTDCATCNSMTECLTCNSGTFLKEKLCAASCGVGYYAVGEICFKCPIGCLECTSASVCT